MSDFSPFIVVCAIRDSARMTGWYTWATDIPHGADLTGMDIIAVLEGKRCGPAVVCKWCEEDLPKRCQSQRVC